MTKVLINEQNLYDIADAIRLKNKQTNLYTPEEMASAIDEITVAEAEHKDINFYDYDGTILYSYYTDELLALTELPPNPEHPGLIAQGWNWTLDELKAYVQNNAHMNGQGCVGQNYTTDDGSTKVYLSLKDISVLTGLFSLRVGKGTVYIDWGDGSPYEAVTYNNGSNMKDYDVQHIYDSLDDYVIRVIPEGNVDWTLKYWNYGCTFWHYNNSSDYSRNYLHGSCLTKVEFGNNIKSLPSSSIGGSAVNLKYVTFPRNLTGIASAFINCSSLCGAMIYPPNTRTSGVNISQSQTLLRAIIFPNHVEGIDASLSNLLPNSPRFLQDIMLPSNLTLCPYIPYIRNHKQPYVSYGIKTINSSINTTSYLEVSIPSSVTKITATGLFNGYRGTVINLSNNITDFGSTTFSQVYSIYELEIPSSLVSMGDSVFSNSSLVKIDFSKLQSVPKIGKNIFNGTTNNPYFRAIVPYSLFVEWKAVANWSTYIPYTVGKALGSDLGVQGDALPTTDSSGVAITWFSDDICTNEVSAIEDVSAYYYCKNS